MKKALIVLGFLLIFSVGCRKEEDFEYLTAILKHAGFDFSTGVSDTSWQKNDADIVNWRPDNPDTNLPYPSWKNYLWLRTQADTINYKSETKDMGTVELSSIKNASGIVWDTLPIPLIVGHCIIAKCRDGYAKVEVTTVGDSTLWEAQVKYSYSPTTTFDH